MGSPPPGGGVRPRWWTNPNQRGLKHLRASEHTHAHTHLSHETANAHTHPLARDTRMGHTQHLSRETANTHTHPLARDTRMGHTPLARSSLGHTHTHTLTRTRRSHVPLWVTRTHSHAPTARTFHPHTFYPHARTRRAPFVRADGRRTGTRSATAPHSAPPFPRASIASTMPMGDRGHPLSPIGLMLCQGGCEGAPPLPPRSHTNMLHAPPLTPTGQVHRTAETDQHQHQTHRHA